MTAARRAPGWRRRARGPLVVVLAVGLALSACAHAPTIGAIGLRITSNVPDAAVVIDDRLVGRAADWQRPHFVRAGFHRIEIREPGYYSFFREIDAAVGSEVVVDATLHELVE